MVKYYSLNSIFEFYNSILHQFSVWIRALPLSDVSRTSMLLDRCTAGQKWMKNLNTRHKGKHFLHPLRHYNFVGILHIVLGTWGFVVQRNHIFSKYISNGMIDLISQWHLSPFLTVQKSCDVQSQHWSFWLHSNSTPKICGLAYHTCKMKGFRHQNSALLSLYIL